MRMQTCSTIAPLATFVIAPSASRSSFQESLRVQFEEMGVALARQQRDKAEREADEQANIRGDSRAGDLQAREGPTPLISSQLNRTLTRLEVTFTYMVRRVFAHAALRRADAQREGVDGQRRGEDAEVGERILHGLFGAGEPHKGFGQPQRQGRDDEREKQPSPPANCAW